MLLLFVNERNEKGGFAIFLCWIMGMFLFLLELNFDENDKIKMVKMEQRYAYDYILSKRRMQQQETR